MAKSKKSTKKKATKKKTKTQKGKSEPKLTPEQERVVALQQQVVQATSEIVQDVQSGKIRGFVMVAITDSADTDMLRFAGINPPARLAYLLELAGRVNMDQAVANIRAANAQAEGAGADS